MGLGLGCSGRACASADGVHDGPAGRLSQRIHGWVSGMFTGPNGEAVVGGVAVNHLLVDIIPDTEAGAIVAE